MHKICSAALAGTMLISGVANAQRSGDLLSAREDREVTEQRNLAFFEWNDRYREDCRAHCRPHGRVYHRGAYVGPRGFHYRPVVIGSRMQPEFYAQRYVIDDPHSYRLQSPRGHGRHWVRYGNDVALVDTHNGLVTQVYRNFFD